MADRVELADAREWLRRQDPGRARAIVFDHPYAVATPVRGREDGAAGSVFSPFGFLHETLLASAWALMPGGIVIMFSDWRRFADMGQMATMSGLRPAGCVAWVRTRPGTGGLFRSSWDPILIASRGTPEAVDRAAVRNVVTTFDDVVCADYEIPRRHPYSKPPEVLEHILRRVCRRGDLVLDPFAGSASSRVAAGKLGLELDWRGCDIDPQFAEKQVTA